VTRSAGTARRNVSTWHSAARGDGVHPGDEGEGTRRQDAGAPSGGATRRRGHFLRRGVAATRGQRDAMFPPGTRRRGATVCIREMREKEHAGKMPALPVAARRGRRGHLLRRGVAATREVSVLLLVAIFIAQTHGRWLPTVTHRKWRFAGVEVEWFGFGGWRWREHCAFRFGLLVAGL